jgi:RNA polymerase sigma-70 factor (ECF subfamily)
MEGMSLAPLFVPHLPAALRPGPPAAAALEPQLRTLIDRARAPWPGVALGDEVFLRHVAERMADEEGGLRALDSLHASDLYLACACARGDEQALAAFEARFMSEVPAYVAQAGITAAFVAELQQVLRTRVLVGEGGGPPRLASYAGRGPLAGWLRMVALRAAVNMRASDAARREVSADRLAPARAAAPDPEVELLRTRYAEQFTAAFRAAVAALPAREANAIRLHFLDGLTMTEVGALYRVNERTVRRWLAEARRRIVEETRRRLVESAALTSSELTGLVALLSSELDVTLVRLLRRPED